MIGKFLPRTTFLFALIMLFSTIFLLPMDLFADNTDHDNLSVHDVDVQTMLGLHYSDFIFYGSTYANIFNSSNIPVRYYISSNLYLFRNNIEFKSKEFGDKGWVQGGGGSKSCFPPALKYDLRSNFQKRRGQFRAEGDIEVLLKFDFNGDGDFDDQAVRKSSASFKFENEE